MTTPTQKSKAQIVATMGPTSAAIETLRAMVAHEMNIARLNLAWGTFDEHAKQIKLIREVAAEANRHIPILVDLPGPRIQETDSHTYDHTATSSITDHDKECLRFGIEQNVDYFGLSFVGQPEDVAVCRELIKISGGSQKIVAKIERKKAMEALDAIIATADAVMVARGDLGNELPIEQIPFAEHTIITKAKHAGKPVITATQMLLSMTENSLPTRAEVTDVANAILQGSDAVMLSEETSTGKHPIEAVIMMEKIILEAERHLGNRLHINPL